MVAMYGKNLSDFFAHRTAAYSFVSASGVVCSISFRVLGDCLVDGCSPESFCPHVPNYRGIAQGLNVCFRGRDESRFGVLGRVGVWSGISG